MSVVMRFVQIDTPRREYYDENKRAHTHSAHVEISVRAMMHRVMRMRDSALRHCAKSRCAHAIVRVSAPRRPFDNQIVHMSLFMMPNVTSHIEVDVTMTRAREQGSAQNRRMPSAYKLLVSPHPSVTSLYLMPSDFCPVDERLPARPCLPAMLPFLLPCYVCDIDTLMLRPLIVTVVAS